MRLQGQTTLTGTLVANTPTDLEHGLMRVPSMVCPVVNATAAASAVSIVWDVTNSDENNIRVVASASCDYVIQCIQ